jgi:hypothetical protein
MFSVVVLHFFLLNILFYTIINYIFKFIFSSYLLLVYGNIIDSIKLLLFRRIFQIYLLISPFITSIFQKIFNISECSYTSSTPVCMAFVSFTSFNLLARDPRAMLTVCVSSGDLTLVHLSQFDLMQMVGFLSMLRLLL